MAVLAPSKTLSLPQWVKDDVFWHGSLFILGSMVEREPKFRPLLHKFVNLDESTIDFFGMKKAVSSWSHSEKIMIKLAAHLFNQIHKFNLSDLNYLGSKNMKIALKAMEIRYQK